MATSNPISSREYYCKTIFKNIRRGIFKEGGDTVGGVDFGDPPPTILDVEASDEH